MTERRVDYMPIAEIEPAARNPKAHATHAIAASINRYGLAELPLIDERTGRLVAGHGRLNDLIARRHAGDDPPAGVKLGPGGAGDWLIPVIRGWASTTDQDAEAYLVASNRLTALGGWDDTGLADLLADLRDTDADLLAVTGYTDDDIAALLAEPERTELPDAGGSGGGDSRDRAIKPPPRTAPGDMWALGNHRVLCGDATNPEHVDQLLDALDEPPTLVITDPPVIPLPNADGELTTDPAADAFRLAQALLPSATQVWWGANHYTGAAGLPDGSCWLIWDKQTSRDTVNDADLAWTNFEGPTRRLVHLWNGTSRGSETDTRRAHPHQQPAALFDWVFETVDRRAERRTVLDLFAGSGPVLLAAESSGRTCAAMELSPDYVDVICRRWQDMTGRIPERLHDDSGREPVDFTVT